MTVGAIGTGFGISYYNPMMAAGSVSGRSETAYQTNGIGQDDENENENGKVMKNPGESTVKEPGRKSSPAECDTCKNRKYQDGSDEMVSFKSASHISPEASASRVRAHEQEHVSNAYKKAAQKGGEVVSCSVTLQTQICPECGRSYVAGGETSTQIKYRNEENPYQKALKTQDESKYAGMALDMAV